MVADTTKHNFIVCINNEIFEALNVICKEYDRRVAYSFERRNQRAFSLWLQSAYDSLIIGNKTVDATSDLLDVIDQVCVNYFEESICDSYTTEIHRKVVKWLEFIGKKRISGKL